LQRNPGEVDVSQVDAGHVAEPGSTGEIAV
jgi:hypothetical protein